MWDETWILIENSPVFRQQSERYSIKNWQCLRLLLLLLYNKFSNFTSILLLSKNLNAATRKRVREPHHLSSNRTIPPQKLYFFSSFPIPLLLCLPLFGRFLRAYRISFSPLSSEPQTTSFIAQASTARSEIRTFAAVEFALCSFMIVWKECWKQKHGKLGRERSKSDEN